MNTNLILISALGLAISSIFAALPYWLLFLPGMDSYLWLSVGTNYFLVSLIGVGCIGLPIGLMSIYILKTISPLTLKSILIASMICSSLLVLILLLATGPFSLVFFPGVFMAAISMAIWVWKFILPKLTISSGDNQVD